MTDSRQAYWWLDDLPAREAEIADEPYLATFDDEPAVMADLIHLDRLAVGGTMSAPPRRYPLWKGMVGWACAIGCAAVVVALAWVML